jgi:phosphomannomutase / phosphoglucomutase
MIPRHIFREYDIRGLHATELTDEVAVAVGRAFGTVLSRAGGSRVALGYDVRPSSVRLVAAVERGFVSAGLTVERVGLVPTPTLYFTVATRGLAGGLMVTGSHNPPEFNGFKMAKLKAPVFGSEIQAMLQMIERGDFASGAGAVTDTPILDDYRATLVDRLGSPRGLKVVIDCGNGCGGLVTPQVFERMGHTVIPLYAELDGTFPHHLADPTVPAYMQDLVAAVKKEGADLGIAFDGDADRIGAVTDDGRIVFGDQLLALLARDVLTRVPGGEIIFDVKCSQGLIEDITAQGGKPTMWKTGHSLIKQKLIETGAPIAGEMSGHMFFSEGYFGYDDAMFAAGRLLRYVAASGRTFGALVDSIPHYFATPETRLSCPEERKFVIPEEIKKAFGSKYKVIDIDGARVEFGDGWGLVRASNTQPVVVVRFEARTPERLREIEEMMMTPLREMGVGEAAAH